MSFAGIVRILRNIFRISFDRGPFVGECIKDENVGTMGLLALLVRSFRSNIRTMAVKCLSEAADGLKIVKGNRCR